MKPSLLKIHGHFYLLQLLVRIIRLVVSISLVPLSSFLLNKQGKNSKNNVKVPVKMLASEGGIYDVIILYFKINLCISIVRKVRILDLSSFSNIRFFELKHVLMLIIS